MPRTNCIFFSRFIAFTFFRNDVNKNRPFCFFRMF